MEPPPNPTIKFPQPMIAIVGDSGTGKSTSLRNLPWDRTMLIDTEIKGLPFDAQPKHYVAAKSTSATLDALRKAKLNKDLRYIVIDSFTKFAEYNLAECSKMYTGYDIYKQYSLKIKELLDAMRSDTHIVVMTAIPELVKIASESGTEVNARRIFIHGRELEAKIEKEFLYVFFTSAKVAKDKTEYQFVTNTDGVCSAKSPMGKFAGRIDNDLAAALKVIDKG